MNGSDQPRLKLFYRHHVIGEIIFQSGRQCMLTYRKDWTHEGFPISPHLPFNQDIDTGSVCRFIQNLFPEGSAFERLIEIESLSRNNLYAILKTIGHDTAGALSFSSEDIDTSTTLRKISTEEVIERLKDQSQKDLAFWDGKYRLSVAGVQNKLNVFCNKAGEYFLAEGRYASTHILKFSNSRFPNIVLNEFLSMRLAKAVNLPVAEVELISFGDYRALKVTRFDRRLSGDNVLKRHIIDGCQALNLDPGSKYEQNFSHARDVAHIRNGASLPKLFEFANATNIPAQTKQQIINWVLFNLIIGNSDAHGKNISFYVNKTGLTLTPFYDLVSVVFEQQDNPEIDTHLAMAIDDNFDINQIRIYDLLSLSEEIGFKPSLLKRRFERMILLCDQQIELLSFSQLQQNEQACLTRFQSLIKQRIKYFKNELSQFDEVYTSAFKE